MRASEFRETERLQVAVASFSTLHCLSLRHWLARACIELWRLASTNLPPSTLQSFVTPVYNHM